MSKPGETFFTSVGCMDGRSEYAVAKWGREKFSVKYADAITEAGLVGLIAGRKPDEGLLNSLKNKILISIEKHHSKNVVVSGHQECAGNLVSDSRHKKDVLKTAEVINAIVLDKAKVIPVFVKRNNMDWTVEEL